MAEEYGTFCLIHCAWILQ